MYFYSTTPLPRSNAPVNLQKMNAIKAYLGHYANLLSLNWIAKTAKTFEARHQANREMAICQRKLVYWERHQNYDQAAALRGVADLKRAFKSA